jgi:hypothetical protein
MSGRAGGGGAGDLRYSIFVLLQYELLIELGMYSHLRPQSLLHP